MEYRKTFVSIMKDRFKSLREELENLTQIEEHRVELIGRIAECVEKSGVDLLTYWIGQDLVELHCHDEKDSVKIVGNLIDEFGATFDKLFDGWRTPPLWKYDTYIGKVRVIITPAHPNPRCVPKQEVRELKVWVCEKGGM